MSAPRDTNAAGSMGDAARAGEAPFLLACARKPVARVPVWYMRQAGRCLPEYRALKEKYDILTLCRTPELAAQVSLMPVERFGVDAAILFADIMLPLIAAGVDLKIVEGVGPVITRPISTASDVQALRTLSAESDLHYLEDTIRILRAELKSGVVPLIGFSGAPFTLASYLIEGKPSRDFSKTKRFMHEAPEAWGALMRTLTDSVIYYLRLQVRAGVQAIQLFDSWAGCLSKEDYAAFVLPYSREIFSALGNAGAPDGAGSAAGDGVRVPRIHFGTNTAAFLKDFSLVDCEVVGVDWRLPLGEAWSAIGHDKAIQGNLDPAILLCDFDIVKKSVDTIFAGIAARGVDGIGNDPHRGFIFNLGHGVLPDTPFETLVKLTEYVHGK